VGTSVLS